MKELKSSKSHNRIKTGDKVKVINVKRDSSWYETDKTNSLYLIGATGTVGTIDSLYSSYYSCELLDVQFPNGHLFSASIYVGGVQLRKVEDAENKF